jgi:hypothetical protein
MGFRFRKTIRILPGLGLNISKSGVSATLGKRGAAINIGEHGVRGTVGLPGTGISYSEKLDANPATPGARFWRWVFWLVVIGAVAFVLSSCGGGGGSAGTCFGSDEVCFGVQPGPGGTPAPPDALAGIFKGTTASGRAVHAVGDDNGNLWLLYSGAGAPATLEGLEEGTASASNGTVTVADLADLSAVSSVVAHGSLSGTYTSKASLNATSSFAQVGSINATFQTGSDAVVLTSAIAGTYTGTASRPGVSEAATLTVGSGGSLSGTIGSSCQVTGSASPEINVSAYSVTLSFAGSGCPAVATAVAGVAVLDGSTLLIGTLNSARTSGFLFAGSK